MIQCEILELVESQLGEQQVDDSNNMFRARAIALHGAMAPVLAWMRDNKDMPINIETMRRALELHSIWMLATQRTFCSRDAKTGAAIEIPIPDIPDDIVDRASAYLDQLSGYDISISRKEHKDDEPSQQHGFALLYFSATFAQLGLRTEP